MSLETLIVFGLESFLLLMVPGPSAMLVVAIVLSQGRRAMLAVVVGVAAGDFVLVCLALVGVGAVVAASPTLFEVLKWFGVCFIAYLGIQSFRHTTVPQALAVSSQDRQPLWLLAGQGFIVTALNPEGMAFLINFLPQFIDADKPIVAQAVTLAVLFAPIAAVSRLIYAIGAEGARSLISAERMGRWLRWVSGPRPSLRR